MFLEMFDKLRIKIPILASLITTIYCFLNDVNFLRTCYIIISTIIIFYILGSFAEFSLKEYVEKYKLLTLKEKLMQEEEERRLKEEEEKKKLIEESLENDIENLYSAIDSELAGEKKLDENIEKVDENSIYDETIENKENENNKSDENIQHNNENINDESKLEDNLELKKLETDLKDEQFLNTNLIDDILKLDAENIEKSYNSSTQNEN